jgi:hypothetical protein
MGPGIQERGPVKKVYALMKRGLFLINIMELIFFNSKQIGFMNVKHLM